MKIIIIGCPGAGKSTFTRQINEFLNYPVIHLDKIYYTCGKEHITREELIRKVKDFASKNSNWIIDGNYLSTLKMRVELADTIILLNIPSEICLKNARDREKEYLENGANREDMAKDFDGKMSAEFITFIENFEENTLPRIKKILSEYPEKNIKIINSYDELDVFVERLDKSLR